MAFDPVPWFIGGGAEHSPEVARMVAFTAFRGNEGIMGPADLAVKALAVPGTSVRVMPGACAINSRAAGGTYQAYAGRAVSETVVPIATTSSSGGRSDLIVARVEDPFMPGEPWSEPTDVTAGPYIFPRVIAGVPAGTKTVAGLGLGYSAVALARVDLPVSTGTVTQAMITDLRTIANPRRQRRVDVVFPATAVNWDAASWKTGATSAALSIPSWATYARIVVTATGLKLNVGSTYGSMRAEMGAVVTQSTTYDENWLGGTARTTYATAGEVSIPAALRGTAQAVALRGWRTVGTGYLTVDAGTTVVYDVEFYEVPE